MLVEVWVAGFRHQTRQACLLPQKSVTQSSPRRRLSLGARLGREATPAFNSLLHRWITVQTLVLIRQSNSQTPKQSIRTFSKEKYQVNNQRQEHKSLRIHVISGKGLRRYAKGKIYRRCKCMKVALTLWLTSCRHCRSLVHNMRYNQQPWWQGQGQT